MASVKRSFTAAGFTLSLTMACADPRAADVKSGDAQAAELDMHPPTADSLFNNPVSGTLSADPSIVMADGLYHYVKSTGSGIDLYQSATLAALTSAAPVHIVQLPQAGSFGDNCDLWAPELRQINGSWWVYYAATSSAGTGNTCNSTDRNATHRMFAASADSSSATGTWTRRGKLAPPDSDHWAIDGTTLQMPNGDLYFVWSGTAEGQPEGGFPQQLFIAPMSGPGALSGARVMIASPTNAWEQIGQGSTFGWINEGPEAIVHNGVVSLVFSANGSWDNRYALGITTLTGQNPLDPTAWHKNNAGPIFSQNVTAWGTGHHTFFTSADGTEQWIGFHSFNVANGGWNSREVRAQRILGWNADNTPNLGSPVARGAFVEPSRNGLHASFGSYRKLYNPNSGLCLDVPNDTTASGAKLQLWTCNGANAQRFDLQDNGNATVRMVTQSADKCLDISGASHDDGAALNQWDCNGGSNQVFALQATSAGQVTVRLPFSGKCLDVQHSGTTPGTPVRQWTCNGTAAQQWVVLESSFDDGQAYQVLSMASGKCVDVQDDATADGTRIRQWTCNGAAAQKYVFKQVAVSNGLAYYQLVNSGTGKCVQVDSGSTTPGAQLLQATCGGADALDQQWRTTSLGEGAYTLNVRHTQQNLDLSVGSPADDARLQQWPANGLAPQTWSIRL